MIQSARLTAFARQNRATPTRGESVFWESVRNRRFDGLKFKRQTPIGAFIIDFYCDEYKLCVEIDGKGHDDEKDKWRDAWLKQNGYCVVHLKDEIVITSTELAMNEIRAVIRHLTLTPSPQGEGRAQFPSPLGEGLGMR